MVGKKGEERREKRGTEGEKGREGMEEKGREVLLDGWRQDEEK